MQESKLKKTNLNTNHAKETLKDYNNKTYVF